jgi:Arc/MetJ family transcription regulator
MVKRTTIEIDEELLRRAKRALGEDTARGAVEHALRLAADGAETARQNRAARQRRFLSEAGRHLDLKVLASERMWR